MIIVVIVHRNALPGDFCSHHICKVQPSWYTHIPIYLHVCTYAAPNNHTTTRHPQSASASDMELEETYKYDIYVKRIIQHWVS